MNQKKRLLGVLAVSAAGLALFVLLHKNGTVPMHFDLSGAADAYGSKWVYLAFAALPFLMLGIPNLLARLLPVKAGNAALHARVSSGLALLFAAIGWVLTVSAFSGAARLQPYALPGLLLLLGAFLCWISPELQNTEPNRLVGIRTKATLSDPAVWRKTHAFAAKSGWLGGLVLMAAAIVALLLPSAARVLLIIGSCGAVLCCLAPALYAQRLAKGKSKR